jgi:DNA-binding GntR family transcriptional regulator
VLEGHAAWLAAHRITDEEVRDLERSCDRFSELRTSADHLPELADENFAFHGIILGASHSERLARMVNEMTALPLIYQSYMNYTARQRRVVEREHRKITDALRRRDAGQAGELMRAHVVWAGHVVLADYPQIG